jgi:chemotaxis signal transduction protein
MMKKILLFQIGSIQYGIELPLVRGIKSAKPIVSGETKGDICFSRVLEGRETTIYELASIFGDKIASHRFKNEKLIMAELDGRPLAMIVSGVKQVISVNHDQLMPLSPIFEGPSLLCFPYTLKHEGSLILLLKPEGIVKVVEDKGDHFNAMDLPDSGYAAHVIEEDFAHISDGSAIVDSGVISLVDCWKSETENFESLHVSDDSEITTLLEDGGRVDTPPELFDITGVDDEASCESMSFLANHLQNDEEALPQTEQDDI